MTYQTSILLPAISYDRSCLPFYNTDNDYITGQKHKASAYYFSYDSGHQTVSTSLKEFEGVIIIEGTLASEPTDSDWAEVFVIGYDSSRITDNIVYDIVGNFLWIRARVERFSHGTIHEIRLMS